MAYPCRPAHTHPHSCSKSGCRCGGTHSREYVCMRASVSASAGAVSVLVTNCMHANATSLGERMGRGPTGTQAILRNCDNTAMRSQSLLVRGEEGRRGGRRRDPHASLPQHWPTAHPHAQCWSPAYSRGDTCRRTTGAHSARDPCMHAHTQKVRCRPSIETLSGHAKSSKPHIKICMKGTSAPSEPTHRSGPTMTAAKLKMR